MPQSKRVESALSAELSGFVHANMRHRMHQILESLESSERALLMQVLERMAEKNADKSLRATHTYSYRWLAETLTKHGHPISKNQIRHYMAYMHGQADAK